MKKIIKADQRYLSDMGNIKSYFLFSFGEYHDDENIHFGALRVFNDDCIASGAGFPSHPHKYFEILTIMRQGTITHKDSLGNIEKIHAGEIQVTNTGSGIFHSEINEDREDIQLYQLWFMPQEQVDIPRYYTVSFIDTDFHNTLVTLASGIESHQNALVSKVRIRRGIYSFGQTLDIIPEKYFFLYVAYGKIELPNGDIIEAHDQLRLYAEDALRINFLEETEIVIVESL